MNCDDDAEASHNTNHALIRGVHSVVRDNKNLNNF